MCFLNLYVSGTLYVEAYAGSEVRASIHDAIDLAKRLNCIVILLFNDTIIRCNKESSSLELSERYHQTISKR